MNKKQYNNVINWTVKHDSAAQTEDSLATARAVFNNMGVALPNGSMQEVYETIKTNGYMGWRGCTMQEAQTAADNGTAAIGISADRIVVLSATDEEQPVTQTASVMTISENTSVYSVSGLEYYTYGYGTTGEGGCNSQSNFWFPNASLSVFVGWKGYNYLSGNAMYPICWSSSNTSVASVDYYSGYITAKNAGVVTITARCTSNSCTCATFEIWVKGKTPVFLIHGRTGNSKYTWGVNTNIPGGQNDHFDSNINAESLNGMKYTEHIAHRINSFDPNKGETDTDNPCNLGNELLSAGYEENINLFAFNYPNEDAVKHSARKFKAYIDNLILYVRTMGSDKMKACFYASKIDYNNNNYKINIVGHSMGGLVARYYIENLYQDNYVNKLITICTPHWGSGYADLSNLTSIDHKLCDHDLDFDSVMFGGNNPNRYKFDENGCQIMINDWKCINHSYELSSELLYSESRNTRYYAIAGVDYDAAYLDLNDYTFEMPTDFTTSQEIVDYLKSKNVYKVIIETLPIVDKPDPQKIGDNMVGFLSQIGWVGDNPDINTPAPRIQMEKIFVDVDTNGGNGGEVFIWEVAIGQGQNIFHSKVNHRKPVCDKVIEYLEG